ncbi:hypothetical protein glysoja_043064 [Glycine soja]|uniref:Uncharacterized protein n=1 Tax=Glycine soja TaxID=3848 RepID=A0A0B2SKN6_GLYSO|nr:hypothetical protein glysoja_043064 [Glycine soja]
MTAATDGTNRQNHDAVSTFLLGQRGFRSRPESANSRKAQWKECRAGSSQRVLSRVTGELGAGESEEERLVVGDDLPHALEVHRVVLDAHDGGVGESFGGIKSMLFDMAVLTFTRSVLRSMVEEDLLYLVIYIEMCSATNYKTKSIGDMCILIQMWAWEQCTTLTPRRTPPIIENKPLGHRWLRRGNQHIGNDDLILFRRKLDIMKRHEKLPPLAAIHLPSCGFHMTILRRFDPPLQWPVVLVCPGFHGKYVAQPWYRFLAEGDFVHGDELSFYYRPRDNIWEIVIRK